MNYSILEVPLDLNQNFESMNLEAASNYLSWFNSVRKERLEVLSKFALGNNLVLSSANLVSLYFFLKENIYHSNDSQFKETKFPHDDDLPYFNKELYNISLNYFCIAEPTRSICFDIGVYLGELLIQDIADSSWSYEKDVSKIGYAQPSIFQLDRNNHMGVLNVPVHLILDIILESKGEYPPAKEPHLTFENYYINCTKMFK